MFEHVKIQSPDDFFLTLEERRGRGIYFYRINGYNRQIEEFIGKYYEAARTGGVVIEGRISNPDGKNLAYYNEVMGADFQLSMGFLTSSLKKWMPRMNEYQRNTVAASMYDTLDMLRKNGKNENMLKNAYIKFMCWLYYRFERIAGRLGDDRVPKILYEGDISLYELLLMEVLANAGCDVVLLQYAGDGNYRKLDAASVMSDRLELPDMGSFPEGFSLERVREEMQRRLDTQRLYGKLPETVNCTNAWISGKGLEDFETKMAERGNDPNLFYNCFYRINGAEDKLTYLSELYRFRQELVNSGRRLVIVDREIPQPSMEEIGAVRRKNYGRQEEMLIDLSRNISYTANAELQRLMVKGFVDVMLEETGKDTGRETGKEAGKKEVSLNRLTSRAVILLCWLKRYQEGLFAGWKMPETGCFIHMGGCKNDKEALFLKLLSRLPVDVLVLNPDLNTRCCLQDRLLYEVNYGESLAADKFPQEKAGLQIGTAAYQAERELDTMLYGDSGMYRNQQYGRAVSVTLQTTYEEIAILWKQELKYRPNFVTVNDTVNMPVIFAKVSGVKDGRPDAYWTAVKALQTEETFLIKNGPAVDTSGENPMKPYAAAFFKNGRLLKNKIKQHPSYPYGVLREAVQDHILEKLQLLIERKIIKGTFENGTEYTIIATVLNMEKAMIRLIQKFDFTKHNPKVVYINTTEKAISLEDSILTAFLNLVGFDIVFFVPTGYQSVERHFNMRVMEEHQIGEYMYDLQIPDFNAVPSNTRPTWRDRIFKKK